MPEVFSGIQQSVIQTGQGREIHFAALFLCLPLFHIDAAAQQKKGYGGTAAGKA